MLLRGGVYVGVEAREKEEAIDEILAFFCDEGKYTKGHKTKIKTDVYNNKERIGTTKSKFLRPRSIN